MSGNSLLDFGGQEITIGKLVLYAQGGKLKCGTVERLTPKKVVIHNGPMVLETNVFVLDDKWSVTT